MTACKDELLSLVQNAPSGQATPRRLTQKILSCVRLLETKSPTSQEDSLQMIQGPWELLWTAQDPSSPESKRNWIINPIENQSYSNNPEGRSNPFLPLEIQDALEKMGWVSSSGSPSNPNVRSTQTISGELVRNIVAFNVGSGGTNNSKRASVTLDIQARPDIFDERRINVRFDRCRVAIPSLRIDFDFRLGWLGPMGWIQNVYVDEDLRVTRGHKGSVFVLTRPRRAAV